jgi:hypothetical protein
MKSFVEDLLALYGPVKTFITPALGDLFEKGEGERVNDVDRASFHTTVAKLLYLSKRTRYDIALPVAYLCTRVSCATVGDVKKLDRVMGFLKLTKRRELVLTYRGAWDVAGYIDAAFGCHHDGKSQSGCIVRVGGAPVLVISRKQKIVTKDSTEAELVALSDLVTEVERCDEFMKEQGVQDLEVPVVYQDNTSTISLVTEGGGKPRTKHLRVRQHLVKEKIDKKEVRVEYIPTKDMLADVLTKPLQGVSFREMVSEIMGN